MIGVAGASLGKWARRIDANDSQPALTVNQRGSGDLLITTLNGDTVMRVTSGRKMIVAGAANPPTPKALLHVWNGETGLTPHASANLVIESTGAHTAFDNTIHFLSATNQRAGLVFSFGSGSYRGAVIYDQGVLGLTLYIEGSRRYRFYSTGIYCEQATQFYSPSGGAFQFNPGGVGSTDGVWIGRSAGTGVKLGIGGDATIDGIWRLFQTDPVTHTIATSKTNLDYHFFGRPTIAASAAATVTDAYSVYIAGAPVAGTNVTITNSWALWVAGGNCRFDGDLLPEADNMHNVGTASRRWALVRAVTITSGDFVFENGWRLTEAEKVGAGEGIALVRPDGSVATVFN